jgi:transcriptional regulator with XRE-family HTH domain
MDKKEVGRLLRQRREEIGFSPIEMGIRAYCNRTTIMRIENGTSGITLPRVRQYAQAYQVAPEQLGQWLGFTELPERAIHDQEILVTTEDIDYLKIVTSGLQTPLNFAMVRELLVRRNKLSSG